MFSIICIWELKTKSTLRVCALIYVYYAFYLYRYMLKQSVYLDLKSMKKTNLIEIVFEWYALQWLRRETAKRELINIQQTDFLMLLIQAMC